MSIEIFPGEPDAVTRTSGEAGRTKSALIAVGAVVVVWSVSTVAIKATTTSGMVASFYRLWFAVAGLWLAVLVLPALRRRLDRVWLRASLWGGLLFGLHQILFFNAVKLTSVAEVVLIAALQPVLVAMVAGPLFGESVGLRDLLWALLALAGTAVVVLGSACAETWSLWGDAVAVLNLLAFTAYFLASKRFRSFLGAPEYMVGMTTVAAVLVSAVTIGTGEDLASPTGGDLLILFLVALLPGTLGHLTVNWAHAHAPAFAISIMILAVPVIASACALFFLHEPLNFIQISGGVAVLISIGMVIRATRR